MRLSAVKINHISHLIADELENESSVKLLAEKNDVRLKIKVLITKELKLDDIVDEKIRKSISSMSRKIPEGSREWEVLYNKMFEEEMEKLRR